MKNDTQQLLETFFRLSNEIAEDLARDVRGTVDDLTLQTKIMDRLTDNMPGTIPMERVRGFVRELASLTRNHARSHTVAYLGPAGTFSETAMLSFFGSSVEKIPCTSIPAVFRQVERDEALYGIVPVENSTEGSVTYTMDELMDTSLFVVGEQYVDISIALLALDGSFDTITKVYSHPQPLAQCKEWLRANLPHVEIVETESTARAAQQASQEHGSAAVGSETASPTYGLNILARSIEDRRQNSTRFFVIHRHPAAPSRSDKTALVLSVKDKPGALISVLRPLEELGINMTRIESRPDKKKMWAYNFFIDILGHREDPQVARAIEVIKPETVFLKILGSFPSAEVSNHYGV